MQGQLAGSKHRRQAAWKKEGALTGEIMRLAFFD
jgi:hypothetical protein